MLDKCFNVNVVQKIIRIPVSLTEKSDKFYWKLTKHGRYSVKSSYEMAKHLNKQDPSRQLDLESSRSRNEWAIWKSL